MVSDDMHGSEKSHPQESFSTTVIVPRVMEGNTLDCIGQYIMCLHNFPEYYQLIAMKLFKIILVLQFHSNKQRIFQHLLLIGNT